MARTERAIDRTVNRQMKLKMKTKHCKFRWAKRERARIHLAVRSNFNLMAQQENRFSLFARSLDLSLPLSHFFFTSSSSSSALFCFLFACVRTFRMHNSKRIKCAATQFQIFIICISNFSNLTSILIRRK